MVDSTGYRIKLVDLSGDVVGTLERPVPPTPVTPGIEEREKQRRVDELAAQEGSGGMTVMVRGGSGGGTVDRAGIDRMMEARLESMIFSFAAQHGD